MTTTTAPEATMTDNTIVREAPYVHVVPGTYTPAGSEKLTLQHITINGDLVGVIVDGEVHDPCKRCVVGGHYSFNGQDSICYGCHGYSHGKSTTEADILRRYIARQKAAERRERQAREAAEKKAAELAAWINANTDLWTDLKSFLPAMEHDPYSEYAVRRPATTFLAKLAVQVYDDLKPLSEKQTAAAKDAISAKQAKDTERVEAGHWGTVGKRAEATVTIVRTRSFEGDYGTRWLVTMKTEEGHTMKTWTSGSFVSDALDAERDGTTLRIKATVKEHGAYNGLPETTVARVATV